MIDRRVALVTGGARGIGLGISKCLANEGCALALCGTREPEQAEGVLNVLRELGCQVQYTKADISIREDRNNLIHAIRHTYGRLDILINNAGIAPPVRADILDAGEESFEKLIRVNLQGPYFLTQAVARWMIEQKTGDPERAFCITTVTSISADTASVNRGDYCISKAGLSMAARLWAVRLSEYGIPSYEVRPGIIRTEMTASVTAKYDALISDGILLQPRWGTPEDVGRAVAMLVRGDLLYSTGSIIHVDGGFSVERL